MIVSEIKRNFEKYIPDYRAKKYLVACSAGPDSMVLTHIMLMLKLDIQLAHVNFGLRGEESNADETFVKTFADAHQLILHKKNINIAHESLMNESTQMTARRTRYAFFHEVLDMCRLDYCLTAHHLDDNIETFFLNLIRGAGIKGLTGMPELHGKIFRPMLSVPKKIIYEFAFSHQIAHRIDSSNSENHYKRNLLRNEVLPHIHRHFPAFSLKMAETFKYMKDAEFFIQQSIQTFKENHVNVLTDKVQIDKKAIDEHPAGRTLLKELLGEYGINSKISNDIYKNLTSDTGAVFNAGEKSIIFNRDKIEITSPFKQFDTKYFKLENHFNIYIKKHIDELQMLDNKEVCVLDADKIIAPLVLRTWKKGDVFYPIGMKGKKKISDFYTEKKMSRAEKEKQLLLCVGDEIAWVVNHRIDKRFAVESGTQRFAVLIPVKKT